MKLAWIAHNESGSEQGGTDDKTDLQSRQLHPAPCAQHPPVELQSHCPLVLSVRRGKPPHCNTTSGGAPPPPIRMPTVCLQHQSQRMHACCKISGVPRNFREAVSLVPQRCGGFTAAAA